MNYHHHNSFPSPNSPQGDQPTHHLHHHTPHVPTCYQAIQEWDLDDLWPLSCRKLFQPLQSLLELVAKLPPQEQAELLRRGEQEGIPKSPSITESKDVWESFLKDFCDFLRTLVLHDDILFLLLVALSRYFDKLEMLGIPRRLLFA